MLVSMLHSTGHSLLAEAPVSALGLHKSFQGSPVPPRWAPPRSAQKVPRLQATFRRLGQQMPGQRYGPLLSGARFCKIARASCTCVSSLCRPLLCRFSLPVLGMTLLALPGHKVASNVCCLVSSSHPPGQLTQGHPLPSRLFPRAITVCSTCTSRTAVVTQRMVLNPPTVHASSAAAAVVNL